MSSINVNLTNSHEPFRVHISKKAGTYILLVVCTVKMYVPARGYFGKP